MTIILRNWAVADARGDDGRRLLDTVALDSDAALPLEAGGRFYSATATIDRAAMLVLTLRSPRPLRLWIGGVLVLDESLFWRSFQREVRGGVVHPVTPGSVRIDVEVGVRPRHHPFVDASCPSRNRAAALAAVEASRPDKLTVSARIVDGGGPAVALRYLPTQYRDADLLWQHVVMRSTPGMTTAPPSTDQASVADTPPPVLLLRAGGVGVEARERTSSAEMRHGIRRFHVPVAALGDLPPPLRSSDAAETRVEPVIEVARMIDLTIEDAAGSVTTAMPVYEPRGRNAPQSGYRAIAWPDIAAIESAVPEPVLPDRLAHLLPLYRAAWAMLRGLVADPAPDSGLPNGFVSTGSNFTYFQFVWDTALTTLCLAYGDRALSATASLDVLYAAQFDGGYIHRQTDIRDGTPTLFEPDFSPNPPLLSLAEWRVACVTGDVARLKRVYPLLADHHRWLMRNRRLPDGSFWTTGLASGLDNAPSLGDGYPDLTAQMAHDADILGRIADVLGLADDAARWMKARDEIAAALNDRLWDAGANIYATSLPDGGHNPNKIVTAFWPLFAGVAPPDRAAAMVAHLTDPARFARHHPIPSLAADAPGFRPEGRYWQGSVWPPTNYMAITGVARAGYRQVARDTAVRHLQCVWEVWRDTGHIWENYASEASVRGSLSGPNYSWSALGPVALLLEIVIGLRPRAIDMAIDWSVPADETIGVRNYPLGPATISLMHRAAPTGRAIEVTTDRRFRLMIDDGAMAIDVPIGTSVHYPWGGTGGGSPLG